MRPRLLSPRNRHSPSRKRIVFAYVPRAVNSNRVVLLHAIGYTKDMWRQRHVWAVMSALAVVSSCSQGVAKVEVVKCNHSDRTHSFTMTVEDGDLHAREIWYPDTCRSRHAFFHASEFLVSHPLVGQHHVLGGGSLADLPLVQSSTLQLQNGSNPPTLRAHTELVCGSDVSVMYTNMSC